jgi:signal transduction histidine kinase
MKSTKSADLRLKSAAKTLPSPLIPIFILAVLLPSIALSFLALRAADRESLYAEQRFESALAAEVGLAAREAEGAMRGISLEMEELASASPEDWRTANSLAGVPFTLTDGNLVVYDEVAHDWEKDAFLESFGAFLRGESSLPTYDSVTRIYRPAPGVPSKSDGLARQEAESMMVSDSDVMEEAFTQASEEGFEIGRRNVEPIAGAPKTMAGSQKPAAPSPAELSRTVSLRRSFAEISGESESGLLPRLSEDGLSILFWARAPSANAIVGCSLNMDAVRGRIAEALPGVLTEARVLNALDENGLPLVETAALSGIDWRRPYVAREISPILPRWEVGAWLVDPGAPASRARFTRLAVSVMVAILFVVIAAGGALVIRAVRLESRVASQKTTFVANVSHELKTPLTSIKLFSELLLSGKQADEERRKEYLRTMVSEADRLSRLVDDVLTFSKRGKNGGKYPMRPVDLAEIAKDTLSRMEPHLAKNGFSVGMDAEGPLSVMGDREAIVQIVTNMLSNAEKYSGDIREISLASRRDGKFAVLEVMDRGIGVEPRIAVKIFQEFFRGDDSLSSMRSGAGLGLPIARDLARRHGGDVVYAPREGGGSVFSLSLPLIGEGGNS